MVAIRSNHRNVRILLVGDRSVGKTSLILSLVCEEFPEEVPPKAEEITIPADVTPEQVPTHIVDYSAAEQSDESLLEEIRKANVICVVYAVDDENSIERIATYWLPFIRECSFQRTPVVLVGNKVDLIDYTTIDAGFNIMDDFPEIETCIECSAKTLNNISELFFYAQKAVLHPTAPIYKVETEQLSDTCQNALKRIFKICDIDNDGLLNDFELNNFQTRCFNAPLQPQVIEDVKAMIKKNVDEGVTRNCVTLVGFMALNKLFIQRGRNETIWSVLRKFGYDDSLELSNEYLHPQLKVPLSATAELSHRGQQFLQYLFDRHDKDKDGALCTNEESDLFSICPRKPWDDIYYDSVVTNEHGHLTQSGFMCQWVLMTMLNVAKTMEYLGYLGFNIMENDSQLVAINVTREKKIDLLKRNSSRNVYVCHVIGPRQCGKTQFCKSLVGKKSSAGKKTSRFTINNVQVYGQEKYLILRDIDVKNIMDPLHPSEVQCDVACLVYDHNNPKSFEYVARIYIKYFAESKIPVMVLATKYDLPDVKQEYLLAPDVFCKKYKIMPVQHFSMYHANKSDTFVKLATMAAFPNFRHFNFLECDATVWWKAGLGLAAATAFSVVLMKMFRTADKLR